MPGSRPKSLLPPHVHQWVYFVSLCILVAAMPTSRFVMSLIQIIMGINWLLEGNYKEKSRRFFRSKPALFFSLLYLLHVVGLLWSQDLAYGIGSDLKNKLPMLTLTFLVVSSRPISDIKARILLYVFFAAVLVTSFIGFHIFITGNYVNFRHIAPFVSHLYLGMMIVMTMFTLPWLTHKTTRDKRLVYGSYLVSLWLFVFLVIMRSFTGFLCLSGVILFFLLRQIYFKKKVWSRVGYLLVLAALAVLFMSIPVYMYHKVSKEIPPGNYGDDLQTSLGNPYQHFPDNTMRENGHYVYYFIAEGELREAWNQRSNYDFDGEDLNGNQLKSTLYRYMSSMGLRKDREALMTLTREDIKAVEKGVANYLYTQWPGLLSRVHQTVWELYWYKTYGDPTGHTFTQRLELWRGSWVAFMEKPWLGWGTGDIYIAVHFGLEAIDSPMENYHMKPHNQYLLFLLTLGLVGSLLLYGFYYRYAQITGAFYYLPFNVFLVIMAVSMLGNNPIDAQAGQTFFSFFTLYFGIICQPLGKDKAKL